MKEGDIFKATVWWKGMRHQGRLQNITFLMQGVGETDCLECGGSGWWGFGPTEDECGPCVDCKGTGRILVGI